MSNMEAFDDFDSMEIANDLSATTPSFQHLKKRDDDSIQEWLKEQLGILEKRSESRISSYRRWSALYKGLHWKVIEANSSNRDSDYVSSGKKPRMVDNFISEFIDARVSQVARFGSAFTAIPWNNEIQDQNTAKACEKLLKARADEIDFDKIIRDSDKIKYKYGTAFIKSCWNKEIGPIDPRYKELEEMYPEGIPSPIVKRLKDAEVYKNIGDVELKVVTPDRIFPEYIPDNGDWTKIRYLFETEWMDKWDLIADYPKYKDKLENHERSYYDYTNNEVSVPSSSVRVVHFYHPPTKYLPKGEYIMFCDGCILKRTAYPYTSGKLPYEADRDIEIEGDLWGRPRITHIEQMQRQYNNISSSQARDLGAGSAPKWVAPKGSVDYKTFNNDFTLFEFRGPVAPQLVKGNPISSDGIVIQDRYEKRMSKLMQVYDISRGEVPQGITANSALRFLDEQEGQILADDERKRKSKVLNTYRMMIKLMAQKYTAEDGRTLRTLGKNNAYMIESLKKADFNKVYDVQFQNTSALPDTKTGKIAAIIDLNAATQTDPIFRREDVVNMLDLGTDETFTEESTYSLDTAKQYLESILNGDVPPEPEMHDDLMVYYTTWMRAIQSYNFKTTVPDELKQVMYTYIQTVEGLLFLKAQRNTKLASELAINSSFPSFFEIPVVPPVAPTESQITEAGGEEIQTSKMKNTNEAIEQARSAETQQ